MRKLHIKRLIFSSTHRWSPKVTTIFHVSWRRESVASFKQIFTKMHDRWRLSSALCVYWLVCLCQCLSNGAFWSDQDELISALARPGRPETPRSRSAYRWKLQLKWKIKLIAKMTSTLQIHATPWCRKLRHEICCSYIQDRTKIFLLRHPFVICNFNDIYDLITAFLYQIESELLNLEVLILEIWHKKNFARDSSLQFDDVWFSSKYCDEVDR